MPETARTPHQEALVVGDVNRRLIICGQVLPAHYLFKHGLLVGVPQPPLLATQMRWGARVRVLTDKNMHGTALLAAQMHGGAQVRTVADGHARRSVHELMQLAWELRAM